MIVMVRLPANECHRNIICHYEMLFKSDFVVLETASELIISSAD